jgi:hypothetical protein
MPAGRFAVVALEGVEAPHPYLHDLADEAFMALKQAAADRAGWDLLAELVNAYVPLTTSLEPGRAGDWLYTGRAVEFSQLPVNAGWMAVVREDLGSETFWRVYLRVRYQDGSAGRPLHDQPWDFSSRYNGDTVAFEQGGRLSASIPAGYWLDLTTLALDYGWHRIPAHSSWRMAYPSTHFNELVYSEGLGWRDAMQELYPPEALMTPTPLVPPTHTPTRTPRWFQTATPTLTSTPRPTLTPLPPTQTSAPPPTSTASPAAPAATNPTRTPTSPGAATGKP